MGVFIILSLLLLRLLIVRSLKPPLPCHEVGIVKRNPSPLVVGQERLRSGEHWLFPYDPFFGLRTLLLLRNEFLCNPIDLLLPKDQGLVLICVFSYVFVCLLLTIGAFTPCRTLCECAVLECIASSVPTTGHRGLFGCPLPAPYGCVLLYF